METLDTVLFGKYQLCRILGTGRVGTVFLAVHLGLSEYRAIKRVPKSFLKYDSFRREALILKELRHPGIPIVYDIEEDESYSYLIEEYLEGESLYDLVRRQDHLPQRLVIRYGIQLTQIVNYLHLAGKTPLLHLDLQPKNLLVCHETVKLIDFDHAAFFEEANALTDRYGTVGCAAPEQYEKDGMLDERTDLYAIGVILHYLYAGTLPAVPYEPPPSMSPEFAVILSTCLEQKRERRFSSAQELNERLQQLEMRETAVNASLQSLSLIIALAGSKPGAGTTHVAVGLSCYLNRLGYPNLYEEKNHSGMGAGLGAFSGALRDRYGLMRYRGFVWKPAYGPGVKLADPPYRIRIADYGSDVESAAAAKKDALIIICDSRCWSMEKADNAIKMAVDSKTSCLAAYNHLSKKTRIRPPDGLDQKQCFKIPYFAEPFRESEDSRSFYHAVLENLSLMEEVDTGRNRLIRSFRKGEKVVRRWGKNWGKFVKNIRKSAGSLWQ